VKNVIYGDAARHETLLAAGVSRASVLIISFADDAAAERVLEHVRQLNPDLPVIVRTLDEKDIDALRHAGAAEVVPETLEASMVLAAHALRHLGVPNAQVRERFRQTRLGRLPDAARLLPRRERPRRRGARQRRSAPARDPARRRRACRRAHAWRTRACRNSASK
jgi:voltage-gated potassium channel Kch